MLLPMPNLQNTRPTRTATVALWTFPLLFACALRAQSPARAPKAARPARSVDWPTYGNDAGGLKYSPLTDINRTNVAQLAVAFTWRNNEDAIPASEG
jgi:glucose dehydrogenase